MNVSNWEDNINDNNEDSKYDSNSTKKAARNRNVRQPKGLLDDSEDSITTNSGSKTVTGTNSKESSDDENTILREVQETTGSNGFKEALCSKSTP